MDNSDTIKKEQFAEEQGILRVGYKKPPVQTRFQKGQSGNPAGVKKGTNFISEAYKRLMAMPIAMFEKYKPKNVTEEMAKQMIDRAIHGNPAAALRATEEIANRTEGKARQAVQRTDEGESLSASPVVNLIIEEAYGEPHKVRA